MKKDIGIIGLTGRMGSVLAEMVRANPEYNLGISFSRATAEKLPLREVFKANDYVVDFSSAELAQAIFEAAIKTPKPLVLCSTGWNRDKLSASLKSLAKSVPVIVAPNTSLGACLQRYLAIKLAKLLGPEYDIDILEQHHRNKLDSPSGTALALADGIKEAKMTLNLKYQCHHTAPDGARMKNIITISSRRIGNISGEHEVSFTSAEEMISIKHIAFNKSLFAKGAMLAVHWLEKTKPLPGIYTMSDILGVI